MNIAQKTVLITGANRGIGRALVQEAMRRGVKKVYAGTRGTIDIADERLTPLTLDVTNVEQIEQAVREVGSLDVLINNSGIAPYDDLSDPAVIEQTLAVNFFGMYKVSRAFLPMLKRSKGAIVNNLSLMALAEAASLLDGSTASINSALQRARETLSNRYSDRRPPFESQPTPAQQKLLVRYLRAWEGHDVDGFVAVLKEDATAIMPPWLQWFIGRETIGTFFAAAWKTCGGLHLVPTSANGQPAFAIYEFSTADKRWNFHSIHVLTLEGEEISAITLFLDPSLFQHFGLSQFLPDDANSGVQNPSHHA